MIKLKYLKEALEYSPEKIDAFVTKATKDLGEIKKVFDILVNKVEDLSLSSAIESPEKTNDLLEKIKQTKQYTDKIHTTYFDVVDMYDFIGAPQNVKNLEKINDKIDNINNDLDYLQSTVESVNDAVKYFKRITKDVES